MLKKPFLKKLKNDAREKLDLKEIFPRSKVNLNKKLNNYQLRTIKSALNKLKKAERLESERVAARYPREIEGVIYPDKPEHYEAAGFLRDGKKIFTTSKSLKIITTYKHKGKYSFYKAVFFGGVAEVQLVPLIELPDFLEGIMLMEDEEGQFYDKISLREGDRNMHGQSSGFSDMADNAEELYLKLLQYKRHGALIGEGGTFKYVQVCFISLKG